MKRRGDKGRSKLIEHVETADNLGENIVHQINELMTDVVTEKLNAYTHDACAPETSITQVRPRGNPMGSHKETLGEALGETLWETLGNPRGSLRVSPRVPLGVPPRGSPRGSPRVSQRVSPHARSSQERTGRSGGYLSKHSGRDESGWCSDVPSSSQAWKDAGVRFPLEVGLIVLECVVMQCHHNALQDLHLQWVDLCKVCAPSSVWALERKKRAQEREP